MTRLDSAKAILTYGSGFFALIACGAAGAQQRVFDVPAQAAVRSIPEFARQAGFQIVAPAESLNGVVTPPLKGELDAREALRELLQKTDLVVASDTGGVITLRRRPRGQTNIEASGRNSTMKKLSLLAGLGVSVLALAPAKGAQAQAANSSSAVEEVVVTATKTGATNLQKTPLSISVVGGEALDQSRVVTLRDLPSAVPALKVTNNSNNLVVYVRGVGGFASNNEADVSIYMDGVYLGRNSIALQSNFNDLARVEVVKGPQGTLFGRNAVGGALNFISKAPSSSFSFENTLTVGNYNLIDEAFTISGPLSEKAQASLSYGHLIRDGYLDNILPGMPDINNADRQNFRAQLRWELTDKITNLVRADYIFTNENWTTSQTLLLRTNDPSNISCNGTTLICTYAGFEAPLANSIVGDYSKFVSALTPHNMEQAYGINDELTWEVNDHLTITNLIAYRTDKSINFTTTNGTEYAASSVHSDYRQHQFSEELNFRHNFGPLTGVAGFFFYQDYQNQVGNTINPGGNPQRPGAGNETANDARFPTISRAVFLSETYHVSPALGITVGARYTQEHKVLDKWNSSYVWIGDAFTGRRGATSPPQGGPDPRTLFIFPFIVGYGSTDPATDKLRQDSHNLSPKVGVEWQATDDAFFYASATRGFKSGGFAFTARNNFGASYEPENITAYEIGAKTDWFDKRLRVNLSVFRNDWTDLQVTISQSIPGIAVPLNTSANAGKARITGFDIDIIAKPLEGLTLTASGSFLPEAKYLQFDSGQVNGYIKNLLIASKDPREHGLNAENTYDAAGKRLVQTPKSAFVFAGRKDFNLPGGAGIYLRGEYQYTSESFSDISNHPVSRIPGYSLTNAVLGFIPAGGHWEASLWGRNLADTQYATNINVGTLPVLNPGSPRTFGVRVNYKY